MLAAPDSHRTHILHLILSFGLAGFFLVSVVDSSFVPLPVPGISDLMIIFFAAQHTNLFLLVGVATAGSALGGYLSFQVGHKGGMQFLEKHVPKRIFKRVCGWMEQHAILSVALPAILPPPMPLSPFVLAAGALKMSVRTFMVSFTGSRLAPPYARCLGRCLLWQAGAAALESLLGQVGHDHPHRLLGLPSGLRRHRNLAAVSHVQGHARRSAEKHIGCRRKLKTAPQHGVQI